MGPWLRVGVVTGAVSLAWAGAHLSACRNKDKCSNVDCDFTRVEVEIVDAEGEAGEATLVTYTLHPYKKNGQLLTEDELDDAGVDITEEREAVCTSDEDDDCSQWMAAAGFGIYTFTAVLQDEDGVELDRTTLEVDLPPPASSENELCCGLVDSTEVELTLDEDGADTGVEDDTGDSGDTADTAT